MWKCVSVASRLVFACAFIAAAWSPASAADLGNYNRSYKDYGDPIVVPPLSFSWTGFYFGAHLGYGWGSSASFNEPALGNGDGFDGNVSAVDLDPSGWLGGITAGYNWHIDAFVFGLEADFGYLGAEDSIRNALVYADTEYGTYGTLSARIGYSDSRWMFYAKGGLAFADIETEAGAVNGGAVDPTDFTQDDEMRTGWALGVGIEHAFQPDLSLKVEYLYMDFGESSTGNFDGDVFTHENDIHTLKVGINYRLQQPAEPLR